MPNAKFCNSCPASAAVVASVDSVLTTVPLCTTILSVLTLIRRFYWTFSKVVYKVAIGIILYRMSKLCHQNFSRATCAASYYQV